MNEQQKLDVTRFYRFVRPYRFRAGTALAFTALFGVFDPAIAYLLKPFTDGVILSGGGDAGIDVNVTYYPVLIVIVALAQSLVSYASNYLVTWCGKKVANDVKAALFDTLMHADPAMFDRTTSGEILLRYNGDADVASEGLLTNVKTLVTRFVTSIGLICLLFYISWVLALVAVGALVLAAIPLNRVRRQLKKFINDSVQAGAAVTTNFNEAYSGNRVIASYNLYGFARERLRRTLSDIFRLNIKMTQRTSFLSLAMHFATSVGIAATVSLQGYMIVTNRITPGDFIAFMTALLLLYTPIKKIGGNFSSVQMSMMAIRRVLEKLEEKPAIAGGTAVLDGIRQGIVYSGVDFRYEPEKPVLKGISLEIPVGQSVAFVGNSGGGKTTLVNLLPRFYDVTAGSISIDGVDIRHIDLASLRDHIAFVFQDNFLFGGTIRDNIILGKRDATEEEIGRAVRAACLDEFVTGLGHGLDTQIGERGAMLSGGQKQRVAIARAFLKDAPVVILDEATSALDNQSEKVVQQAIENLMRNKTVLIIAHRLSTVINADRIVVIRDGEMVESGRHNELMARPDGIYASLYRTQLT